MSEKLILVVDDDPDIRTMLVDLLQYHGYDVCAACNGVDALKKLDSCVPALVILDLWMPIMNGAGFVREIERRGIELPIVVMTAAPNPVQLAQELGADGYLQKPFELVDLLDSVGRVYPRAPSEPKGGRRRANTSQRPRKTSPDQSAPSLPFEAHPPDSSGSGC